jgi:Ankyrin repeats (3 copies)
MEREHSLVEQFEAAADAVVSGDIAELERLLRAYPELIHARSTLSHHATLLHYVGANGVEDCRQKTPKNIVRVTEILLRAGSDIDAKADMYGEKVTTLALAATSIHPLRAGVLDELIGMLLVHGASVDNPGGKSIVNSCLANGRSRGAELMAAHGARLDLEGAAGLGRLEIVESFFDADGRLKANATREQMKDGFAWACEYGRTRVVNFLLDNGIEIDERGRPHGQTGLHWAAYNAHVDTVKLLLAKNARVDLLDASWEGTPLAWALHSWGDSNADEPGERFYETVRYLVAAGATVKPEWLADQKIRADARMAAALRR